VSEKTVIRRRDKTGQPPVQPVVPQAVFVEPPTLPPMPIVGGGTRSGFCREGAPDWSHQRCKRHLGTPSRPATCVCECHDGRVR
jgi:hypothetical protein